jgi:hypothetical protein
MRAKHTCGKQGIVIRANSRNNQQARAGALIAGLSGESLDVEWRPVAEHRQVCNAAQAAWRRGLLSLVYIINVNWYYKNG